MRMLCMFDLPVETGEEQRAYRQFRKNIKENKIHTKIIFFRG